MEEMDFFEKPKNLKVIKRVFHLCLVLLFVLDFVLPKQGEFPWERIPGFFAVYGFGACTFLVVIAKQLGRFLRRNEDYYD